MQERLQQQVEQVESLLLREADGHELPACLVQQATQLQVKRPLNTCSLEMRLELMLPWLQTELDAAVGAAGDRCEELRSRVEQQEQYERLLTGLKELLSLGSHRLTRQPGLRSRAQLQQQLSSHEVGESRCFCV